MKTLNSIDWKRITIYSACLTGLFFVGGCAALETVGEGISSVGKAIGIGSVEEGVQAGKQAGEVVSFFYPAIGGALTTIANGVGWFVSSKDRKDKQAVAESLIAAIQNVKEDLENGGEFTSKDQLIEALEDAGATHQKAKELYYDWKKKYKGKEAKKRGIWETVKKIFAFWK